MSDFYKPGCAGLMSNSVEWATPQKLYDDLNRVYKFTLDVCASKYNHKCDKYYTIEDNALEKKWEGRCFMNPPYGRKIGVWIFKAYNSVMNGDCDLVVCLLPARTDTKWFHDYCMKGEIEFIRGRLKFNDGKVPAPFPSMIVIFKSQKER